MEAFVLGIAFSVVTGGRTASARVMAPKISRSFGMKRSRAATRCGLVDKLSSAAKSGRSLQEFLRSELVELATRPSPADLMSRVRESARKWHVPGVNHALRLATTVLYSIEIGNDIEPMHASAEHLAAEQARYQIQFRQDLAELAERSRRPGTT